MDKLFGMAALGAIATILTIPLFKFGFVIGDDTTAHITWASQFDSVLRSGSIYPRWFPDVNLGYGNPTFVFYGPLFYYLVSGIRLITSDLVLAINVACMISFMTSGMTMYLYCRLFFDCIPSLVGAITYIILPYHVLDLYRRAALAEFLAFMWLPLILYFASRLHEGNMRYFAGLSLTYAGVIFTHLPTAVIFTPILVLYSALNGWWAKSPSGVFRSTIAIFLGAGVSSIYLLPAMLEQKFVQIHWTKMVPWGNPLDNFLFSKTAFAKGFNTFVSQIAVTQAPLLVAASFICVVSIYTKSRTTQPSQVKDKNLIFFIALGAMSYLLMTNMSKPLWKPPSPLAMIQFPWRWLMVVCLASGVLVAGCVSHFLSRQQKPTSLLFLTSAISLMSVLTVNTFSAGRVIQKSTQDRTKIDKMIEEVNVFTDVFEFRPVWAPKDHFQPAPRVWLQPGQGKVKVLKWNPEVRVFEVEAKIDGALQVRTFYYPGWIAYIDGAKVDPIPSGSQGIISVNISRGRHTIQLKFLDTRERIVGKIISAMSFSCLLLVIWIDRSGRRQPEFKAWADRLSNSMMRTL